MDGPTWFFKQTKFSKYQLELGKQTTVEYLIGIITGFNKHTKDILLKICQKTCHKLWIGLYKSIDFHYNYAKPKEAWWAGK